MSQRQAVVGHPGVWRTAFEILLAAVVCGALLVLACTVTLGFVLSHG